MRVRFYRFEAIQDGRAFKEAYRANLDSALWGEAERRQIIEESALSFRLTGDMLHDLGPVVGAFARS